MRQYKTHYEISKLNVKELIEYRQFLRNSIREIKHEIKNIESLWESVIAELTYNLDKLQKDIVILEKRRLTAETAAELASLDLQ